MRKVYNVLVCLVIILNLCIINLSILSEKVKGESYTIDLIQTFPGEGPVSDAGDVNNDGFSDVIVGMKSINNTGEAFIYFGGIYVDDIPDVHLKGEEIGDQFGYAVSSAGDVNGDGFSDVIVGAPNYDDIAEDTGRAYIFLGGEPMDNAPDVILTGESVQDYFGSAISTVYDVNKDGFDDVVIGAWGYGISMGKCYVYYGGNPMDNSPDLTIVGKENDYFGDSVSSAGDVNSDGFYDIIIGEPGKDDIDPGWAYIYLGGNPMDNISDVVFTGENASDSFGKSVSSAGDFNRDGFDDVIIGAPWNNATGNHKGRIYLFLGDYNMDNGSDYIWTGKYKPGDLGSRIANASDIDNDGFDDVIFGSFSNGSFFQGSIYIYYGNESLIDLEEFIINGNIISGSFGYSISNAGDVNGNGYCDIIIGSKDNAFVYGPNLAPSISIIEPDGISDIADISYLIKWIDDDLDDNATISLYYCTELADNPKLIQDASELNEDDENDTFFWDTTNVNSGSYFIKAKIDDGVNPEVWAISSGKVTINHSPKITITAPNSINNNADESFLISWIDQDNEDNALISIYYDIDEFGNDGTLIVSDIEEDDGIDTFSWNTTNIPDGLYHIYIEINDGINPIYTNYSSVPLTIHHKMPNLSIQHIQITPSNPIIGEKVIFNMTLINSGDKVAQDCIVELFIDNVLMDEVVVNEVLPDNGAYNVIFEPFTIKSRIHSTLFRVEMNGEEVETWELKVVSQEKEELDLFLVLIPILLLILIIALLLIYKVKRQKRDNKTKNSGINILEVPISCPNCYFSFNIPSEPRPLQIQCPNCGTKGTMK